jgi:nucleoside-diphosphate-sugar epimerase
VAVLRALGAEQVAANLFEVDSLKSALAGSDAILHLATSLPPIMKMGRLSAWKENDRIRREGTRALVEAALAAGSVKIFIYPSFAFVYPDSGDRWIDAETTAVQPAVTLHSTLDAESDVARFAGNGHQGISLRMGGFYGPEPTSWQFLRYARRGIAAFPGAHDAYLPQIWVQDAASAIVTALTQPVPSGVYDLVDDEPLTRGEWFDALAHAVGRKHLWPVPDLLMRLLTGVKYDDMHRSLRISNHRFKTVSDWKPTVPTARVGWARLVEEASRGATSVVGT